MIHSFTVVDLSSFLTQQICLICPPISHEILPCHLLWLMLLRINEGLFGKWNVIRITGNLRSVACEELRAERNEIVKCENGGKEGWVETLGMKSVLYFISGPKPSIKTWLLGYITCVDMPSKSLIYYEWQKYFQKVEILQIWLIISFLRVLWVKKGRIF